MDEPRAFTVAPALRCCALLDRARGARCGELARWQSPGDPVAVEAYWCDTHRRVTDELIAGKCLFRRVHLCVEIYLAATSPVPAIAQADAYDQIARVVKAVGGAVGVLSVTSEIGWGTYPARPRRRGAVGGRAE